jgi:hypothetical protein
MFHYVSTIQNEAPRILLMKHQDETFLNKSLEVMKHRAEKMCEARPFIPNKPLNPKEATWLSQSIPIWRL